MKTIHISFAEIHGKLRNIRTFQEIRKNTKTELNISAREISHTEPGLARGSDRAVPHDASAGPPPRREDAAGRSRGRAAAGGEAGAARPPWGCIRGAVPGACECRSNVGEAERVCGRRCIDQREPQMNKLSQICKMRHNTYVIALHLPETKSELRQIHTPSQFIHLFAFTYCSGFKFMHVRTCVRSDLTWHHVYSNLQMCEQDLS